MATILVEQNVPALMRDGVTLRADVYRPADDARHPVLVSRTPYGKAGIDRATSALRMAQAGYAVVVQDCRGRGASEGEFGYFATLGQEGPDGYDTVEWAAALPYSDGNVGMFGVSYLGWTQWAAAARRPPHLRAIAPIQTWSEYPLASSGYRAGAFELGVQLSWHLMMAIETTTRRLAAAGVAPAEVQGTLGRLIAAIDGLSQDGFGEALPLRDLPSLREAGLSGILAYLLDAGPNGGISGSTIDLSRVEVPSLNVAGWHDILLQPTIDSYTGSRARGSGLARQARLVVGPWAHGESWLMSSTQGERDFGLASSGASIGLKEDLTALQLRWFDRWLRGVENGVGSEPAVQVFLTGENRWLALSDWPPAAEEIPFYLGANGFLGREAPTERESSSHYAYDPTDPAPTLGGPTLLPRVYPPGVRDQRPLSRRSDVLTFAGAPLDRPFLAIGRVSAELWVSSSAPDTDFVVRLVDVHPDGYMENVCDGIARARYRESLDAPSFLEPGRTYELRIDLWSIAHAFRPGHRAAVQVTSSSFPRWDRNWNTREDPGRATSGRVADQTIWHDASRPSRILLPEVLVG